jgi:hypothetical protein
LNPHAIAIEVTSVAWEQTLGGKTSAAHTRVDLLLIWLFAKRIAVSRELGYLDQPHLERDSHFRRDSFQGPRTRMVAKVMNRRARQTWCGRQV